MRIPSFEDIQNKEISDLFDIWTKNHNELLGVINKHGIRDIFLHGTPNDNYDRIEQSRRISYGDFLGLPKLYDKQFLNIDFKHYLICLYHATISSASYGHNKISGTQGKLLIITNVSRINRSLTQSKFNILESQSYIKSLINIDARETIDLFSRFNEEPLFVEFKELAPQLDDRDFKLLGRVDLDNMLLQRYCQNIDIDKLGMGDRRYMFHRLRAQEITNYVLRIIYSI
jgi:hypothetical protein